MSKALEARARERQEAFHVPLPAGDGRPGSEGVGGRVWGHREAEGING